METAELDLHTDLGIGLIHSLEVLHPFLFAGNAVFTLKSKKTQQRFTFKVRSKSTNNNPKTPRNIYFVSVLTGPDNWENYQYLGVVRLLDTKYKHGVNSKVGESAPSAKAAIWFFNTLFSDPEKLFLQAEIWHEGKCGRCGRRLTVPESISIGIGPECLGKM